MSDTIASRMAVMLEGFAAQVPAEVGQVFAGEQADLDAAGPPAGIARSGSSMPEADLLDAHGAPTSLAYIRAGRPAVVVFYRGAWCPYCNVALRAYQEQLYPALVERDAVLVAVSPQRPEGSLSAEKSNELSFPAVSDPGNRLATALGIATEPSPAAQGAQAALGLDLATLNIDGTRAIPMPTVVIVDSDGVIRWIDVHHNYAGRTESADIITAFDSVLPA